MRALLLCALGLEAALLYLLYLGELHTRVPLFWAGIFPAFLLYLTAGFLVLRRPALSARTILLIALLFRLTLWFSPPTLSDDIYRYVWDGRVQLEGINPYLHAPQSAAVAHLRDGLYAGINHKDVPTIYPPLAQLFFRLVCSLSPTLGALKLGLVACEWTLCWLLVAALRQRGQDERSVLLYAWNPLPLVEVAGSGHVDALGVPLVLLALYWLGAGRAAAAVCALALAFLAKLLPVLLLPLFWVRLAPGARLLDPRPRRVLLLFPLLVALGYLPFADAGFRLFSGLQAYLQHWRFNDAAFSLIRAALALWDGQDQARWLCAGALASASVWAALRLADPHRAAFFVLGAYLLLTPTLHPWYLLWILPFLVFFPHPAWIGLSGLVFLAYEVLITYSKSGVWSESTWVKWAQFGPFYFALFACCWRKCPPSRNA